MEIGWRQDRDQHGAGADGALDLFVQLPRRVYVEPVTPHLVARCAKISGQLKREFGFEDAVAQIDIAGAAE